MLGLVHQWITLPVKNDWPVNIPEIQISGGTVMYDLVAVGRVLKELRKQIGKNQVQVAKELNIDASSLCRIEKGNQAMTIDYMLMIADYYNAGLDYIFGRASIVDNEVTSEYNAVPEEKKAAVKDAMLTCIKLGRM